MALPVDRFSNLLCVEDCRLVVENDEFDEEVVNSEPHQKEKKEMLFFDGSTFDCLVITSLLEKEREMMPRADYFSRLHSGDLDVSARNDSVEWIYKVHRHYSFNPLTACLAVNYLDRFISEYQIPCGKQWIFPLLSVSCLSLAAKMEETKLPLPLDLQVVECKPMFEARTIQRMELLLLSVLKWRTNVVTPFSFMDCFLYKLSSKGNQNPKFLIFRSMELILTITKGVEFLEFRSSEIALAVAIYVVGETQTTDFNSAFDSCCSSSTSLLSKEKVLKCYELVQEISSSRMGTVCYGCEALDQCFCVNSQMSPAGVLDAAEFLSYSSSNKTNGSVSSVTMVNGGADESGLAQKRRKLNLSC